MFDQEDQWWILSQDGAWEPVEGGTLRIPERGYGGECRHCGQYDEYPERSEDGKVLCWYCCGGAECN